MIRKIVIVVGVFFGLVLTAMFFAPIEGYYHDKVDDRVLYYESGFVYRLGDNSEATIIARYHNFSTGWRLVSPEGGSTHFRLSPGIFSLNDNARTLTRIWTGYDIADYQKVDPHGIKDITVQEF